MNTTDTSTKIMIEQTNFGVETCPGCGRRVIEPTHGKAESLFWNLKNIDYDFERKSITAVHKLCGEKFELSNWNIH